MNQREQLIAFENKMVEQSRLTPADAEVWRNLAQARLMLGKPELASNDCIEALRLDPKNENALVLMGNILAGGMKKPEEAKKYFEKALEINPKNVYACSNLATLYSTEGDYAKAVKYYYNAVEINPHNLPCRASLAACHFNAKQYDEAYKAALAGIQLGRPSSGDDNEAIYKHLCDIRDHAAAILMEQGKLAKETEQAHENVEDEISDINSRFAKSHGDSDLSIRVMMARYMANAILTFNKMPEVDVKKCTAQLAEQSGNGYDVNSKTTYSIPGLPGKEMTGYEALAYYYVAVKRTVPQALPLLQLPYDNAYDLAEQIAAAES